MVTLLNIRVLGLQGRFGAMRMMVEVMMIRAVAIVLNMLVNSTMGRSPSGVPLMGTSALTGKLSG